MTYPPVSGPPDPVLPESVLPVSGPISVSPVSPAAPVGGPAPFPQMHAPAPLSPVRPPAPFAAVRPPAPVAAVRPPAPVSPMGGPAPVWPPGAHPQPFPTGVPQGGYAVPSGPGYTGGPGYGIAPPAAYRPGPVTPDGWPIATFGERLVAYLVDSMIQSGVVSIVIIPVFLVVLSTEFTNSVDGGTVALTIVGLFVFELAVVGIASYIYHVTLVLKSGSTVGKKLMKLRIVSLDGSTAPVTRQLLVRRWAGQYPMSLVPFYAYVDGFWQLWDQPYRQCLHDKWPRTAVVKVSA